jgi:transcriptional regulator with PAS, ATPase and Fis domain
MNPDNPNLRELTRIPFKQMMGEYEKTLILKAMELAHNNQSLAARILSISRTKLVYRLQTYNEV